VTYLNSEFIQLNQKYINEQYSLDLMYDTIIIGGGCAGLAAAMYAGRLNMKTLLLAGDIGGTITKTDNVENYPGFIKLTGMELAQKLEEHARDYDIEVVEEKADAITKKENCFYVKDRKSTYKAKTLIFATGSKWKKLNIPGEEEFSNKGVHYCALCDGIMYKNKVVSVIGGSDSAAKEALVLAEHASKVYILIRGDKIKGEPINNERVAKNEKIEVLTKTEISEIKGDTFVTHAILKDMRKLDLQGVFVAIGHIPLSDLAIPLGVKINKKKEIPIDRESQTNVPGIFAAGDVCDTVFKQAITGVGEAVSAVYSAYTYVSNSSISYCDENSKK
jgi:thioredoxin reductase (NADPH)